MGPLKMRPHTHTHTREARALLLSFFAAARFNGSSLTGSGAVPVGALGRLHQRVCAGECRLAERRCERAEPAIESVQPGSVQRAAHSERESERGDERGFFINVTHTHTDAR